MAGATIEFHFDSTSDEERFVREYLTGAWERFETTDFWETGWFWPYRQISQYDSGPDGGLVRLVFEGEPEVLVEHESSRWDEFPGLTSWEVQRYDNLGYDSLLEQQQDAKGKIGGEREYRLKSILPQFSLAYSSQFEESLPAVDEESPENPLQLGFWAVIHDLMVQCGYDWYDETVACQKAMKNRLKSIAAYQGADAAREEYKRLLAEWKAYEDELEQWLDENPTGEATEP